MASIKYSGLVTDIKGSIGGTTFKGTRSGTVIQNKVTKPPTTVNGAKITKADAGRQMMTIANNVQGWKGLSAEDRNSWDMAAPNFPFKDKFGNEYTPSGYQLYQSINADLQLISEPVLTLPPTPEAWENCPEFEIVYDISDGELFNDLGTPPTGYAISLFMTRPLSAGTKGNLRDFRYIATAKAGDLFPTDLLPAYQRVFGAVIPTSGAPFYGKITKTDAGRGGMVYAGKVRIAP